MAELWAFGVERLAEGVRAGEFTAAEVVESCLERLAEVEPSTSAYLLCFEREARMRAAEIDRMRSRGQAPGPLAGVPVAVKDNICVAGRPLTCGSGILAGFVSPFSATAVERLEAAGAVLLGKTNLDEFGMGSSCEHSAFGVTRNPWHRGMVPGGSSGGSAAAVASGSTPLALGSDTGGSIRQPAAFCGIVGLKPTYGRISRWGLVAFASSLDQIGPMARSVRDTALAYSAMAGSDSRDATSRDEPLADPLEEIEDGVAGMRVGVLAEIADSDLSADCRRSWRESLERLVELGADLVEVSVPNLGAAIAAYYLIANSEASSNLARFDGIRYGLRVDRPDSLDAVYLGSRGRGLGAEVKRRILLGTFALSAGYYEAYYGRAAAVREALASQFAEVFGRVRVVVTPTTPTAAFAVGEKTADPLAMYLSDVYTTPANLAGLPAVAVPSGRDGRGLPLSVQFTAPALAETTALRAARAFERAIGWRVAPAAAPAAGGPPAGTSGKP